MTNQDEPWDHIPQPSDEQLFPSGAAVSVTPEAKKRWVPTTFTLHRLGGRKTRIGVGVTVVAVLAMVAAYFIARIGPDRHATSLLHVSYAGAASWVQALPDAEKDEQLRDWARLGLAAYLRLDVATLRDTSYDTMPVRDAGFADMVNQFTGAGRSLYDGHGVLHVLVDMGSAHESRTIGLHIDQYRTDAGQDPANVQVHRFTVDKSSRTIGFRSDPVQPVAEVRAKYGYVTARIDTAEGLNDFLRRTMHLSWMEIRQSEVWAGGWNWPDVSALPVEREDVEVLRRAYANGTRPGFSLDPPEKLTPPKELTVADIKAVVPGVNDQMAESLLQGDDQLLKKVKAALFGDQKSLGELASAGLTTDRTRLWALHRIITRTGSYQVAQYFGPLRGTKVGMTLFYADKTAKDWVYGVGKPPGSIPTPDKPFPPSQCSREGDPLDETGRLWFAQNDAGFDLDASHISIGTQATRLNFRANKVASGPHDAADEVEASYLFGRGEEWWDHNYQTVADYEPQYQRLEQIMRWSGALEWLNSKQGRLPKLADEKITSNLLFETWRRDNIRNSAEHPLTFVKPPSADGMEAILQTPSETVEICGLSWIFGGVTLGDLVERSAGVKYTADLPAGMRRARPTDATSKVDGAGGNGVVKRVVPVKGKDAVAGPEYTLSMAGGLSTAVTKAHARTAGAIGRLKLWLGAKADRRITVETRSAEGTILHRTSFNNRPIGELSAESGSLGVTITWKRGPLDRALRILEGMAAKLAGASKDQIAQVIAARQRLGGPGDPLLLITKESGPPTDEMAFGFAVQPPGNGTPEFYVGRLAEQGRSPAGLEQPSPWLDVADTDSPLADYAPAGPPTAGAQNIKVFAPDDTSLGVVYELDGRVTISAGKETLGPRGPPEAGALLREIPAIKEAMRISAQSPRKENVGVRLGSDGVALVSADRVILVPIDHHWARPVLRATDPLNYPPRKPLIVFEGGTTKHIDHGEHTGVSGPENTSLDRVLGVNDVRDVYIDEKLRAKVILDDGALVPSALNQRISVSVRRITPVTAVTGEPRWQPDIRVFEKQDWYRVGPEGDWFGGGGQVTPNNSPGGGVPGQGAPNGGSPGRIKPPPPGVMLFVCLDDGEDNICDYQQQ